MKQYNKKYARKQVYNSHKKIDDYSCILPIDYARKFVYNEARNQGTAQANRPRPQISEKGENTMSKTDIITKIEQIKELEALIDEAQAEADALRDTIKAEMLAQDVEELEAGQYIVYWRTVISNRFDTTAFKKTYADLYKSFTKQTTSRRFSIA